MESSTANQVRIRRSVNALAELAGGEPMPLLFDARNLGWMQMDSHDYIQAHASEVFTDVEAAWRFASGLDDGGAAVP